MAGQAWNHQIRRLEPDEMPRWYLGIWRPFCGGGHCRRPALYEVSYEYVTGRRGRVSRRTVRLCKSHARAFARKHGLDCPEPSAQMHVVIPTTTPGPTPGE